MTVDEIRARVKVGDIVSDLIGRRARVLAKEPDMCVVRLLVSPLQWELSGWGWEHVILPEPPKAEPGVYYQGRGICAGLCGVGLLNGQIGRALVIQPDDFNPDEWDRVEEPCRPRP